MNILAFGAHPDDIEIYMYGLLKVCFDRGDNIFPVVVTDGSLGTVLIKDNLKIIRQKEAIKSLSTFNNPIFLNSKDGSLSSDNKVVQKIKETIIEIKPDLIITHSPLDYHPDHRALSIYVKECAGFLSPILYADTLMGVNFDPTIYIDISKHIEEKLVAIMCHRSQNPEKFVHATKLLNNFRSAQCNGNIEGYAEAYFFEKYFPFSDIKDLLPPSPKTNQYYKKTLNSFL
jgi:N-acetylglucosamine malate deacetylase 1